MIFERINIFQLLKEIKQIRKPNRNVLKLRNKN